MFPTLTHKIPYSTLEEKFYNYAHQCISLFLLPEKAPICCVIPPASPATTDVLLSVSSRVVLPWSTWPIIVTTGGLDSREWLFFFLMKPNWKKKLLVITENNLKFFLQWTKIYTEHFTCIEHIIHSIDSVNILNSEDNWILSRCWTWIYGKLRSLILFIMIINYQESYFQPFFRPCFCFEISVNRSHVVFHHQQLGLVWWKHCA